MSVIQTIRGKYGKLAGGVIALALVGFIISDATNGSLRDLFSSRERDVMEVNGVKIDPREYQMRLKEYETLYSMFNSNRQLDDATRAQLNEQVVQMMVYETVVNEQCDKLGIQTTEQEKKDLIYSQNADPLVRQFQVQGQEVFVNPDTKQFDPAIITYMEKQLAESPDKIDPNGKLREQWDMVKSYVVRMSRVNKYNALFGGSVYVPQYLAKRTAADQNSMASIRYVKVPFTAVADNEVKITDEDLKAYMNKHEALYKTDQPTRTIEYVSFDIVPSSSDTARAINALNEARADFATTKDNKSFVNGRTDNPNSYSEAFLNKRTFTSRNADTLMSLPVGEIYGPYYENGNYLLTKIVDRKTLPDSAKIKHILVKTKDRGNEVRTDTAAKMKIDSAIALIKAGAKFDSVVAIYSEDDGSNKKGGEYTFTLQDKWQISKEFGDYAFEGGKPGESKLVKVSNDAYAGYHYILVEEQKGIAPAVQLATIAKNLIPSDSTINAIYGKANEFAGRNTTADQFDASTKKQGMDKRVGDGIKATSFSIQGLGASREVVRWAYEHNVGDVSPVFQVGDERYVVAKLTAVEEKGIVGLNSANRPVIEQKVREEKKAEIIAKKFGASSLDALAQSWGQTVQQADTVVLNGAYIPNLGYEPKVVGYAFNNAFQPNTVSPAIKGQGGVYFITVLNRQSAPLPPDNMLAQILGQQRMQQEMQIRNTINQQLQQSVSKKAEVEYHVANF
jgi:peptidyl-prolyl cis-trans isomerase D